MQKRFDCLIRAFARIVAGHPEWRLVIVGEGPEEAALRGLIDDLGLAGRVEIQASRPDIFDAYTRAHLFAIPSRWEGFSNALAEAMSHGLPAVGFKDAAGVAQLIADGESGWLADNCDDDESLARALDDAMKNDEERARRGRLRARKHGAVRARGAARGVGLAVRISGREAAMSTALATIGLTCFNAEDTVARAIASALAQDWPNIEVIIVDDASSDASASVIEASIAGDPRARFVRHARNTGPAGARNTVLSSSARRVRRFLR